MFFVFQKVYGVLLKYILTAKGSVNLTDDGGALIGRWVSVVWRDVPLTDDGGALIGTFPWA